MYASLLDPPVDGVLARFTAWLESMALGSVAGVTAVLAVAAVGLLLLAGRIDMRRGSVVIAGCFLIFGARVISNQLGRTSSNDVDATRFPEVAPLQAPATRPARPSADPYAGASFG